MLTNGVLLLVPALALQNYWNGHLRKRLVTKTTELAASKRLRALAGLALKSGSEEEAEQEQAGGEDEDEDEDDDDDNDGSSSRSGKVQRSSGVVSPRTASVAQAASEGERPSSARRHVTRAATGSLKRRQFDDVEMSEEEEGEGQHRRSAGTRGAGGAGTEAAAQTQRKFQAQLAAAAPGVQEQQAEDVRPGSRDSSKDTRSTAEHCSDLLQRDSLHFTRVLSAAGSNSECAAWDLPEVACLNRGS